MTGRLPDVKKAKLYLGMAKRGKSEHPAVQALEANLKPAAKKTEPKPIEKEQTEKAPKAHLHLEIAKGT